VSKRGCIIFNPAARGERAKVLQSHVSGLKENWELMRTTGPNAARALACEAVQNGYETIFAAGGDGTVNEVLNGIGDAPQGFERSRLGVLPFGTVNVFAREIGVPMRLDRALRLLTEHREITIDLPSMKFQGEMAGERFFIQMAGAGLDARAVELADWNLKKRIGQFAYVVSGLKALCEPRRSFQITIESHCLTAQLVLVGNGRFYGGRIPLFSKANPQDGLLDVCVFRKINWFVLSRYVLGFLHPKLLSRGSESYIQTRGFTLASESRTPVELDGEYAGCIPAECCVQPKALRILTPLNL
jgi:diacylglycerol kinase (ATP)